MSESSIPQRNKKDRNNLKQSSSSSSSTNNASNKTKSHEIIANEINRALQSVHCAKLNTLELQKQWRDHLLRMSCLVVLIAMHQSSTPVMECIRELNYVKHLDSNSSSSNDISSVDGSKIAANNL